MNFHVSCCSPVCTELHEGKLLMNENIPMHVDNLFTLLFTSSKFFLDFHASRKTTDLTQTAWCHNSNGTKSRVVNLTVALNQTMGPKTSQVTETQARIIINYSVLRCQSINRYGNLLMFF